MATIAELCKAKRWTKFELTDFAGIRPESTHKWERGSSIPYDRDIRKLAEVSSTHSDEMEIEDDERKEAVQRDPRRRSATAVSSHISARHEHSTW